MKKKTLHPITAARAVLSSEIAALTSAKGKLGSSFEKAISFLTASRGKVIFCGLGKSGLIAKKIAATFTSTGTQAIAIHPIDCLHGDLGMLSADDVVVFVSRSGTSHELLDLVPHFRRFGVPLLGIMESRTCLLGKECDSVLETGHVKEACPFNLAPTSSSTAALALGDALAVVLLKVKGFRKEDFALLHQAGALGRRLQLRVGDLMTVGEAVPQVKRQTSIQNAILEMTSKGLGMTTVVNPNKRPIGIVTDGDLRRLFQKKNYDLNVPVHKILQGRPKHISPDMLAAQALAIMETHSITSLICVDTSKKLAGVLHIHQLLKAGVV